MAGGTDIDVDLRGIERVLKKAAELVPENKMKWIHGDLGRKLLSLERTRIKDQQNLDGSKYDPRADGGKKKMLSKALKGGSDKRFNMLTTAKSVLIIIKDKILVKHHYGLEETVNASDLPDNKTSRKQPATRQQAKRLKELGFKGSQKYLMSRFNQGTAGSIIRREEEKRGISRKHQWIVKTPDRSILGIAKSYPPILINLAKQRILKHINFGGRK